MFAAYRDLLRLRKASPALRRGTLTDLVANETVYAYLRQHGTERVVVALNLGKAPAEVPLPPEVSGAAERLYGEARWVAAPGGPRLETAGASRPRSSDWLDRAAPVAPYERPAAGPAPRRPRSYRAALVSSGGSLASGERMNGASPVTDQYSRAGPRG